MTKYSRIPLFTVAILLLFIVILPIQATAQKDIVVNTRMIEGKHSEPVTVTAAMLDDYLKSRKITDTVHKKGAILQTIASAMLFVKYGSESNIEAALLRAEYYFKHKDDVDKILVIKNKRKMHLMKKGVILKTFPIALGFNPVGQKLAEGDGRTPEGIYQLDGKNYYGNTIGSYHISYPNAEDKERAAKKGLKAGSYIMVHGTDGVKKRKDFTNGCVALSNADLEIFKKMVFIGTTIEIVK